MNISQRIESIRPYGNVICNIFHGKEIVDVKTRLGLCGLEKNGFAYCSEIKFEEAIKTVTNALSEHLWSNEVILNKSIAKEASELFFSALYGDFKLYTNFIYGGIEPLSKSFTDQGILALSEKGVIGILWVFDDEQP